MSGALKRAKLITKKIVCYSTKINIKLAVCGVWLVSQKRRRIYSILLFALNAIQVINGVLLALRSANGSIEVKNEQSASFVSCLLLTAAMILLSLHIPGLILVLHCKHYQIHSFNCWWFIFLCAIGIGDMCLILVLAHLNETEKNVSVQLAIAMDRTNIYKQDRQQINMIQWKLKCCGDVSYHDWLERELTIPFSCCNRFFPAPCISSLNYTLYQQGCRTVIQNSLQINRWIITVSLIITIIVQILILIIGRLFLTSLISSEYQQDPYSASPSWLINNIVFKCQPINQPLIEMKCLKIHNMSSDEMQRRLVRSCLVRKCQQNVFE